MLLDDGPPTEEELCEASMRAEDLKDWLRGVEEEEEAEAEGTEGFQGRGDTWRMLVKLIQHIWETREIPY